MKFSPEQLPEDLAEKWNNMCPEERAAFMEEQKKIINSNVAYLNKEIGESRVGAGIHLLYYKGMEANQLPVMRFDSYFNDKLALNSDYFRKMDKFMQCVEKNVNAPEEAQETICQKEFKDMRLSAFKDQLHYHYMNKRFYMNQISYKQGMSPF